MSVFFNVGNNGTFASMVKSILEELSHKYHIIYYVVLAYMALPKQYYESIDEHTILPEQKLTPPVKGTLLLQAVLLCLIISVVQVRQMHEE